MYYSLMLPLSIQSELLRMTNKYANTVKYKEVVKSQLQNGLGE
jgi:hypothetical protein